MVGVNAFDAADDPEPRIHRADPAADGPGGPGAGRPGRARRRGRHAAALDALRLACDGDENVMPHLIEGARAGATMGELCL